MTAALILLLLLGGTFAVARVIVSRVRRAHLGAGRPPRTVDQDADLAARFLSTVVEFLPSGRTSWGGAMIAELQQVRGRRQRWSFACGCAVATLLGLARAAGSARPFVGAVLAAVTACVAVTAFALVRYPD